MNIAQIREKQFRTQYEIVVLMEMEITIENANSLVVFYSELQSEKDYKLRTEIIVVLISLGFGLHTYLYVYILGRG